MMTTSVVDSTCLRLGQVTRRISSFSSLKYSFTAFGQVLIFSIDVSMIAFPASRWAEMAGAEGFEPPLAVLETAGLPLNLRPSTIGDLPLTTAGRKSAISIVTQATDGPNHPPPAYLISRCAWCFRQCGQNFLNSRRSVVVFLFFVR